jgi:hypothetical protein
VLGRGRLAGENRVVQRSFGSQISYATIGNPMRSRWFTSGKGKQNLVEYVELIVNSIGLCACYLHELNLEIVERCEDYSGRGTDPGVT